MGFLDMLFGGGSDATPTQSPPTPAPVSLFGGDNGIFRLDPDRIRNTLRAAGLSMASSPSWAPFQNLPQTMHLVSQMGDKSSIRSAWERVMLQNGVDPAMAKAASVDPNVAKAALDAAQRQKGLTAAGDLLRRMPSAPGTDDQSTSAPTQGTPQARNDISGLVFGQSLMAPPPMRLASDDAQPSATTNDAPATQSAPPIGTLAAPPSTDDASSQGDPSSDTLPPCRMFARNQRQFDSLH